MFHTDITDIISRENFNEFFEKVGLDNETTEEMDSKSYSPSYSPFKIARAHKARGDRRRKAEDRHRGQRDGKRHPKRDEKEYSHWSISKVTPSVSSLINRGVFDYLDELDGEVAEAEAKAEAEDEKVAYLRFLKEERYEAITLATVYLERVYALDNAIAGLEDED